MKNLYPKFYYSSIGIIIMTLTEIDPYQLTENPFNLFGNKWVLLTAGSLEKYNMMTAAWGTIGILWGEPIAIIYVRPSRYTYEFIEKHENFSISAFSSNHKKILNLCGTKSGRNINKMDIPDLTPKFDEKTVYFQESNLVLFCEKIYYHDIIPERIPKKKIQQFYNSGDFHRVYYGKVLKCLKK